MDVLSITTFLDAAASKDVESQLHFFNRSLLFRLSIPSHGALFVRFAVSSSDASPINMQKCH